MTLCILVDNYKCFAGTYCFDLQEMEAAGYAEMFGTYLPIRRRHISEDRYLHGHCRENLKSHSMGSRSYPYARLGRRNFVIHFDIQTITVPDENYFL